MLPVKIVPVFVDALHEADRERTIRASTHTLDFALSKEVLRALLSIIIDYVRWTQLIPMLAVWGFLCACLLVAAFASFESQGIAALELMIVVFAAAAQMLPETLVPRTADGAIRISGDDLLSVLAWAWLIFSFVATALGSLVGSWLRPAFLQTLRGRLSSAAIAATIVGISFFAVYAAAPERFNGTLTSALPLFIGGPLLAWIVSAWSLTVSTALGLLYDAVDRAYSGSRDE